MSSARWIVIAILTGLACFAIALIWTVSYSAILDSFGPRSVPPEAAGFNAEVENLNLARIIFGYVFLPAVIEGIGFVLIYWMLGLGAKFGLSNLPLFIVLIGLYGYFSHGGTPAEFGKAAAFVALGLLFWNSRSSVGVAGSYGLIALGHFVWNGTSISIWHFRQLAG